jgi:hypothetical protein
MFVVEELNPATHGLLIIDPAMGAMAFGIVGKTSWNGTYLSSFIE